MPCKLRLERSQPCKDGTRLGERVQSAWMVQDLQVLVAQRVGQRGCWVVREKGVRPHGMDWGFYPKCNVTGTSEPGSSQVTTRSPTWCQNVTCLPPPPRVYVPTLLSRGIGRDCSPRGSSAVYLLGIRHQMLLVSLRMLALEMLALVL